MSTSGAPTIPNARTRTCVWAFSLLVTLAAVFAWFGLFVSPAGSGWRNRLHLSIIEPTRLASGTWISGLSPDGTIAVGSRGGLDRRAVVLEVSSLPPPPGSPAHVWTELPIGRGRASAASAATNDMIVGAADGYAALWMKGESGRWERERELLSAVAQSPGVCAGISADGNTIVGTAQRPSSYDDIDAPMMLDAWVVRFGSGQVNAQWLEVPDSTMTVATAISTSGEAVLANASVRGPKPLVFRVDSIFENKRTPAASIPADGFVAKALARNGSLVFGFVTGSVGTEDSFDRLAVVATDTNLSPLRALPLGEGRHWSRALACTPDGTAVVGDCGTVGSTVATLWYKEEPFNLDLTARLAGKLPTGWRLSAGSAVAASPRGHGWYRIAGEAIHEDTGSASGFILDVQP